MTDDAETTPDEILAARAADGNRAAFNDLMQRHKGPLYRFVRHYVGDADDAYDLVQDSFISAWTSLRRYNPERPFRPWLRMIALNKCRDFGRRQAVRRAFLRVFALTASATAPAESETANVEMEHSQRLAALDRAIASLPALYKEPLLLTTVEGLNQDEAAKVLKTTRKAVEMRLHRARRRLQDILKAPETENIDPTSEG